ncbi:hypothetical protein [Gordonia sp. N1V]|uniref:MmyB family transcriptional regulator n=1 Tax=Gordonia sp. N1V TaxID=3034163 RepID=UPI0023E260EB|nr:hypothetical protein [Gordonia sp. N1V]MDF3283897.1 hypothetical protein [Gordonia sp. N1V]
MEHPPMLDNSAPGRANRAVRLSRSRAARVVSELDGAARVAAAQLRLAAGKYPNARALSALVGELATRSIEIRTMWAEHEVRLHFVGTKYFTHPAVGEIELSYRTMDLPSDPGHALTIYHAVPASASADALRLLSAWAVSRTLASSVEPGSAAPSQ